jgi:hypothetical protein
LLSKTFDDAAPAASDARLCFLGSILSWKEVVAVNSATADVSEAAFAAARFPFISNFLSIFLLGTMPITAEDSAAKL